VPQRLAAGQVAPGVFTHRGDGGVDHQRYEQQEADAEDHGKGEKTVTDQGHDPTTFFRLHVPDRIERVLELPEDS